MAYTQADIDHLESRIKRFGGIKSATYETTSTEFDLEAAEQLLARMKREVAGTTRTRLASVSKGL